MKLTHVRRGAEPLRWDDPPLVAQVIVDGVGRPAYAASHVAGR